MHPLGLLGLFIVHLLYIVWNVEQRSKYSVHVVPPEGTVGKAAVKSVNVAVSLRNTVESIGE
jgi:hypothetical protein